MSIYNINFDTKRAIPIQKRAILIKNILISIQDIKFDTKFQL